MAKLTLKDITSGFLATQTINDNNTLIEALVETFLSRDGLAPNTMLATLDMNSNRIINTLDPLLAQDVATKSYVDNILASGIADQAGNAGLFLTTDGSVTSWADPLPTQVGQAGNFLTTNGTVAAWVGGDFLPSPLVANRLVSNDGATPSWRLDFLLTSNTLAGDNANAGALLNAAASSTVPTVVGDKTDPDSGLTSAGVDTPGITAGGILGISWAEASSGVLQRSQMTVGITANPVQTQGNTPLFSSYNEISVAANTGDVVTLPAAVIGQIVTVVNNGANDVAIFPASGEDLGAGVDTSVALSPGGTLQLLGTATGTYVQAFNLGLFGDFTDTQFCASNPNGPCMQNEASSVTNPTFVPDQSSVTSGLGGATGEPAIIALGTAVLVVNAAIGSPVNHFSLTNSTTGNPVSLAALGADADVLLGITGKGAGGVSIAGGQSATLTAAGGDIDLTTGPGGVTSGDSGDLTLATGTVTDGNTGDLIFTTPDAVVGGKGGDFLVTLGDGAGAFNGGDFNVTAGQGGSNTEGGFIELDAGIGDGTAGGGGVTIRGGIGGFTAGTGGQVFIQAGLGGTNGVGGALDLFGGPGSNASAGGVTTLSGGNAGSSTGTGGATVVRGGRKLAGTGDSGALTLETTAGGGAPGNSGVLVIRTGSSVSNDSGNITIETGTAGTTVGFIEFLTGGVQALTINANGDVQLEVVNAAFNTSIASGPAILNESSTGANATLLPNRSALTTGWGGASGNISAVIGGVEQFRYSATDFVGADTNGPLIRNQAVSATVPTFMPDRATPAAGIGANASNSVSIITSSLERLRVDISGNVTHLGVGLRILGGEVSAYALVNETASATNPTLVPDKSALTTGVGSAAANQLSLIALSTEVMQLRSNQITVSQSLFGTTAASYQLENVAASATVPTLIPRRDGLNNGIGAVTAFNVNVISGGVDSFQFGTAQNQSQLPLTVVGNLNLSGTNAAELRNVTSSATTPSVLPNRGSATTGIGGVSGEVSVIGAGVEQITVNVTGVGFFGGTPVGQSAAYTRNATIVEDRTLLASASATILNNNNVLAALIADLQAIGILG